MEPNSNQEPSNDKLIPQSGTEQNKKIEDREGSMGGIDKKMKKVDQFHLPPQNTNELKVAPPVNQSHIALRKVKDLLKIVETS